MSGEFTCPVKLVIKSKFHYNLPRFINFTGELMAKDDNLELNGVVTDCYPNTTFLVKLENGHELLAYLAGKLRKHYIKVLAGDHVRLQISPYDLTKGRIIRRFTKPPRPEDYETPDPEASAE